MTRRALFGLVLLALAAVVGKWTVQPEPKAWPNQWEED